MKSASAIKLGDGYRDRVLGIEGIAGATCRFLSGVDQVRIDWYKDGESKSEWLDVTRVEATGIELDENAIDLHSDHYRDELLEAANAVIQCEGHPHGGTRYTTALGKLVRAVSLAEANDPPRRGSGWPARRA